MGFEKYKYTIWWNIILITIGSMIFSAGAKGVVVHHGFIPGGLFGMGVLIYYILPSISAGIWYFILSMPLFFAGWFYISKRFLFYSLYSMLVTSLSFEIFTFNFNVQNQLYAAILAGGICGFGAGMVLRSLGSNGGLDVLAVILNQKFNIGIGKVYFIFNFLLFALSLFVLDIDLVIVSLILVFILSVTLEYTLALFNQRKIVMIMSEDNSAIAKEIFEKLKISVTFLRGSSADSGRDKNIIMAITNNIMLKPLEEVVFEKDENAIFIVENTFNVIGTGFSKRKMY